jgi:NitT/TauT family transport system ATP-binding protein
MQQLIMDLWHEVEATVLIVTHSIAEAVYLGDRVWIMSGAPGRIAREFSAVIPTTRDADPLEVQESAPFKEAVAEVGQAFREVDLAAEKPKPEKEG